MKNRCVSFFWSRFFEINYFMPLKKNPVTYTFKLIIFVISFVFFFASSDCFINGYPELSKLKKIDGTLVHVEYKDTRRGYKTTFTVKNENYSITFRTYFGMKYAEFLSKNIDSPVSLLWRNEWSLPRFPALPSLHYLKVENEELINYKRSYEVFDGMYRAGIRLGIFTALFSLYLFTSNLLGYRKYRNSIFKEE